MSEGQSIIELSKRELQVLELIVTGASNQDIARQLVISVNTVKVHIRNIFEKLEVQSRTEASLRAIQEGLVAVESETETSSASEVSSRITKTYIINAKPPLILPHWKQVYLFVGTLIALAVVILPLRPRTLPQLALPGPILSAPPTPTPPPTQLNGSSTSRWASHAAMPTSRAGLAVVAIEDRIFAIGGLRDNNQATRSVEIYDTATNTWTEGANKPIATTNIAGAVLNDKIYVPGGCTRDAEAINILEIYDPKVDRWSQGTELPGARCAYGLVTFQDKLYLFGGWNGEKFEDTILVYSPENESWEVLEYTMPRPVGNIGAAVLDETIYLVGGYDGQDEFNQTYAFNPETGQWLEKASLQEKRGGLGLVSNGNNLFAIGGGWNHALSTSEKYDPKTDTWSSFEAPYNSQWRNFGLAVIDTKIYAVGGWDGTHEKYIDSVVSYQFLFEIFIPLPRFGN